MFGFVRIDCRILSEKYLILGLGLIFDTCIMEKEWQRSMPNTGAVNGCIEEKTNKAGN